MSISENDRSRTGLARLWKYVDTRVGIIPLPVYLGLLAVVFGFNKTGAVPQDLLMGSVLLALGGFTCAELGKRLPVARNVGAAAIFATFIPSFLTFHKLLPRLIVQAVTDFNKASNILYLFIASIVVGSILSMDRGVLIKGFLKIFIPLSLGSLAAAVIGTLVGTLLGLGAYHSFFFIVVPIMAGGIGEGAIPLSVGYAAILQRSEGELFPQVLAPVMLGSLMAILGAGTLNYLGTRYPHLSGQGRLQPAAEAESEPLRPIEEELPLPLEVGNIAAAGITAIMLYLVGALAQRLCGIPGPVTMLFLAVTLNLTRAVSPQLAQGARFVFKFFQIAVTYPLLFVIGVAMTPWDKLVSALTLPHLITIAATVASLTATGFLTARRLRMYPIETAIVCACHSGQGGTGDVAILTAGDRMQLMPFAQIATRIGGAITVSLALLFLRGLR